MEIYRRTFFLEANFFSAVKNMLYKIKKTNSFVLRLLSDKTCYTAKESEINNYDGMYCASTNI